MGLRQKPDSALQGRDTGSLSLGGGEGRRNWMDFLPIAERRKTELGTGCLLGTGRLLRLR